MNNKKLATIKKYIEIIGLTTGMITIFFMLIFYLQAGMEDYIIKGIYTNKYGEHWYELSFFIIALITQISILNKKITQTAKYLIKKTLTKNIRKSTTQLQKERYLSA